VKIIHGLEEIDIVPWYECEDCTKHAHFCGQFSALFFLQRFATSDLAIDSLRHLIRAQGHSAIRHFHSDEKVLDRIAQMIARGELHLTRKPLDFRMALPRLSQVACPRAQTQSEPEAPRRQTAEPPPPPPPEEPAFLPDVDAAAIAKALTHASVSGKPFCAE